jgi:hypothetical protein
MFTLLLLLPSNIMFVDCCYYLPISCLSIVVVTILAEARRCVSIIVVIIFQYHVCLVVTILAEARRCVSIIVVIIFH